MKTVSQIPSNFAWYISGFVDGEGSFNISLRRKNDYEVKWQPVLSFNVSQRDITILALMKRHFGCGIVKRRKDGLHSYDVTNPKSLHDVIIPFFNQYHFFSAAKKKNFALFKQAVLIMYRKEHLKTEGFKKILEIREKLNVGAGRTRKYTMSGVLQLIAESSETTR